MERESGWGGGGRVNINIFVFCPNNFFRNKFFKQSFQKKLLVGASVGQSLEQTLFTSKIVGSILATNSCEKSQSTLWRNSWVFSGHSGFLPQGKLTGRVV